MNHEEYSLVRRGSVWYVLDDGEKVNEQGYHEITVKGDGEFEGKIGSKTESFSINGEE